MMVFWILGCRRKMATFRRNILAPFSGLLARVIRYSLLRFSIAFGILNFSDAFEIRRLGMLPNGGRPLLLEDSTEKASEHTGPGWDTNPWSQSATLNRVGAVEVVIPFYELDMSYCKTSLSVASFMIPETGVKLSMCLFDELYHNILQPSVNYFATRKLFNSDAVGQRSKL
jgi:hypothetical protein